MRHNRKTKILATLGPATDRPGVLRTLLAEGVDAVRLNMSHGVHADHARRVRAVRLLSRRLRRHVPVMVDLSGPKLRVGDLPPGGIELGPGAIVTLVPAGRSSGAGRGGAIEIPVPVPALLRAARKGDAFLLDDGLLRIRVVGRRGEAVRCEVEEGGVLTSRKGIALPGSPLALPALSAKDRRDIRFGVDIAADFFALSFVRSANDLRRAARLAGGVPLLAKIERPEAVDDIEAIADSCAGLIVARGDLGVELGPERVPLLQKRILIEANRRGRIAIVATQMLASMERSPIPTRAEATDVANAVLDGADGLLLTGETAGGLHPVEAVRVLGRIVDEVERSDLYLGKCGPPVVLPPGPAEALAAAAVGAAHELDLGALVVISSTGRTVGLLSDHRPAVPIVAVAHDAAAARRLALEWGVIPTEGASHRPGAVARAVARASRILGLPAGRWVGVLHGDESGDGRHLTLTRS